MMYLVIVPPGRPRRRSTPPGGDQQVRGLAELEHGVDVREEHTSPTLEAEHTVDCPGAGGAVCEAITCELTGAWAPAGVALPPEHLLLAAA